MKLTLDFRMFKRAIVITTTIVTPVIAIILENYFSKRDVENFMIDAKSAVKEVESVEINAKSFMRVVIDVMNVVIDIMSVLIGVMKATKNCVKMRNDLLKVTIHLNYFY